MTNSENTPDTQKTPTEGSPGVGDPHADDRRNTVDPAQSPVPSSPPADEEAVRAGEEILERVKPY